MPELPEIETYRRLLLPLIVNRPIVSVEIQRERSINIPVEQFRALVQSQSILRIDRAAKQLIFRLSNGYNLMLHLMLGGWMYYGREEDRPDRTVQVRLQFGCESLYFINLRLGYLHLLNHEEVERVVQRLGPDPFDSSLTPDVLHRKLRAKRTLLKPALVEQSFIAGIGNCYADEICHEAGILPERPCAELQRDESARLLAAMRSVLAEAVRYGGYMEHPLTKEDPLTGGYDERCRVYDRQGEPCPRCGQPIILATLRSRKTYYCRNCQR